MWETRIKSFYDGSIIVQFWFNGEFKFSINGCQDGSSAEVLTSSGHFRAKLIPNIMNGLYVDTKKPNSAAGK